ncbi:PD-(D/E)XK nuclease family protein [Patulibacter sp.]|uniref:PD-(D/E)XK nuclease family protein n=1 Tax=Patulibacter sp. TaxID=1912859 RepID=UPI002722DE6F|nr:PD-(D/E)XK nuclease family protein [Patulibacter sp.]MDO9408695.1 PD-(D/E)XK nuclease family protein [Patulibacter sp.]
MTLQLVTGPTNASKAGVVLGLVRRWGAENRSPVLVVPTGPDADRYRRELLRVSGGVAVGVTVGTFGRLTELVRRAAGVPAATLGPLARERLLATALARVPPGRPLGRTADRPGVRRRLDGLLEELAERGFGPEALHADLEGLDPLEHGVDGQLVDDLRAVLHDVVTAASGLVDGQGHPLPSPAAQARDVRLRVAADPALWAGRPVAFYGFDDLTFGQLALVRTLSRSADVVVSLPFEDERVATSARRDVVDELRAVAAEGVGRAVGATGALPLTGASPELRTAAVARVDRHEVALAAAGGEGGRGLLERRLFELRTPEDPAVPGTAEPTRLEDVVLVEGGSARAEAEALADQLLTAVDELALEWHDVAVAVREAGGAAGARLERELVSRGVPVARRRDVPARRTAVGGAIAALARIRTGAGSADDVVGVLRAGASLENLEAIDGFALALRRAGVLDAGEAERRAQVFSPTLEGLDVLNAVPADRRDPGAEHLLAGLLTALPSFVELTAAPVGAPDRDPERAAGRRIGEHLTALATLAGADAGLLPGPAELAEELAELPVPVGDPPGPGRLEIAAPPALRGRQVAVLALADLREQAFPAPEPVDPLIDRDAREVLSRAGGTTLGLPVSRLAAERMLFLELVARPTRRLVLSRPTASDAGEPVPPAPFLADVLAALAPAAPTVVRRGASAVRPGRRRALADPAPFGSALDAAGREAVRRALLDRERFAVREVERLARCPVCWVVEHLAGAGDDAPDSEAQVHGNLVHRVLDRALSEAAVGRPYGELDPDELVGAGLRALRAEGPAAVAGLPRHRAEVLLRRVEVGVRAVLVALPGRYGPASLQDTEVVVGDGGPVPAVDLGDGAHAVGRIDRVDTVPLPDGGEGVGVVDYKLGTGGAVGASRWASTATLQAALYASAVRTAARSVAYALYQPTAPAGGFDPGARPPAGAELRGVLGGRSGLKEQAAVEAAVEEARLRAAEAVAALRSGVVAPLPGTSVHADAGVCDHPAVARLLG